MRHAKRSRNMFRNVPGYLNRSGGKGALVDDIGVIGAAPSD